MSFPAYPSYQNTGVKWLGVRPSHWTLSRFKQVFRERDERSDDGLEELLSVSAYTGVSPRREIIDDGDHLSRADSLAGYKKCYPNDLVINIMLAWNRGLGFTSNEGIVSPAYCVFKSIDSSEPRYLNYLLRCDQTIRYFKAFSAGVIDSRLRLYPDVFLSLSCALPPPIEQAGIADFLDRETARIDALIEEQQRLIELLKEKRQAVISHAVTKGLDPTAPMKDSGVEWLGEVPAHWRFMKLSRLVDWRRPITYGIVQAGPDVANGVPYVRPADMTDEKGVSDESRLLRTTREIASQYGRSEIRAGDLVCSIGPSFGKVMVVPPSLEGANLTQGTARIALTNGAHARFVFWALRSLGSYAQWEASIGGATFRALNLEPLAETRVPVPSESEQRSIAAFLDRETARIDALVSESETVISILRERRSAVISGAVTGKIDVRGTFRLQPQIENGGHADL